MKNSAFFSIVFVFIISSLCSIDAFAYPKHRHDAVSSQSTSNASSSLHENMSSSQQISFSTHQSVDTDAIEKQDKTKTCAGLPCIDLVPLVDDVYYTVTEPHQTVAQQAAKWGIASNVLTILNTGLKENTVLTPGQKILVEARMSSEPVPYSSGKANRGRIRNARLMPEGEGYFLRNIRTHEWGTNITIQSLMTAFHLYAEQYPDGPAINLGDISKRRGGKASPHKSHQSGRDVDIGFVHTPEATLKAKQHFTRADEENLDIEKTWFFIKTLIQTGNVQQIYVDTTVQKLLWTAAREELTPEQRDIIFSWPHRSTSSSAIFQFWPGHRNHFHVRFKCPPNQPGCHK